MTNKIPTIGVFDSGLGGLTVLAKILHEAPGADIIYFGDTKRAPYGGRSQAELGALTANAFNLLHNKGAEMIVTACNSVSTLLMGDFLETCDLSRERVVEMSEPIARELAKSDMHKVLVLATEATVRSHMYRDALARVGIVATELALPGLVDVIERGGTSAEMYEQIIAQLGHMSTQAYDAVLLGCTHFPLALDAFKSAFGADTHFIDPGRAVARELLSRLPESARTGTGKRTFYTSSKSSVFNNAVHTLIGEQYEVEVV